MRLADDRHVLRDAPARFAKDIQDEVGAKLDLFEGRLSARGALFHFYYPKGGEGDLGYTDDPGFPEFDIPAAKALVDEAPKPIKEGIERDEAEKIKGELEEAGATVELK